MRSSRTCALPMGQVDSTSTTIVFQTDDVPPMDAVAPAQPVTPALVSCIAAPSVASLALVRFVMPLGAVSIALSPARVAPKPSTQLVPFVCTMVSIHAPVKGRPCKR